jgi:tripartite-type tricarboxylate transporter receptor subunit TctC
MTTFRFAAAASAAVLLAGLGAGDALAQAKYPHATVTLVTHSSAGGGSDVFLRALTKHLGPKMGVNFVVENVTGGSGARAVAKVAQAPADGSIFYATTPTYIQTTLLSKPEYGYDSLAPVARVFLDPEVVYARAQGPHADLAAAVRDAKASGKARWGAANPASLERIALVKLNKITDARAVVVSHEGGGDLMINVLNGTLDFGVGEVQEIRAQLEAKQVRLLAVLADGRLPEFPGVATAKEQGLDLSITKFRGLAGPKNIPAATLKMLEDGIAAVLADPSYQKEFAREALLPAFLRHEEAARFTATFATEVGATLRELGVVK